MATTTRNEWNKLATEKTSRIVGGDVEVALMKSTISIYAESKEIAYAAVAHYEAAGSRIVSETYYEADEDLPEAWTIEMSLG